MMIGVVEDFHHTSLREAMEPYMMRFKDEENVEYRSQVITVRLGVAGEGIPIGPESASRR
jgi:hypothetical protein